MQKLLFVVIPLAVLLLLYYLEILSSRQLSILIIVILPVLALIPSKRKRTIQKGLNNNIHFNSNFYDDKQVTEEEEKTNGFQRSLNTTRSEEGSNIPYHDKHVFVLTNRPTTEWENDIEKSGFAKLLQDELSKKKDQIRVLVSVAENTDDEKIEGNTILVLPDRLRIKNIQEKDVPALVNDCIISNQRSHFSTEPIKGSHIFINCHVNRHPYIATCGPRMYKAFCQSLKWYPGVNECSVRRVSSLKAHQAETNMIIYRP